MLRTSQSRAEHETPGCHFSGRRPVRKAPNPMVKTGVSSKRGSHAGNRRVYVICVCRAGGIDWRVLLSHARMRLFDAGNGFSFPRPMCMYMYMLQCTLSSPLYLYDVRKSVRIYTSAPAKGYADCKSGYGGLMRLIVRHGVRLSGTCSRLSCGGRIENTVKSVRFDLYLGVLLSCLVLSHALCVAIFGTGLLRRICSWRNVRDG